MEEFDSNRIVKLTAEIQMLSQQWAQNTIEIGKRLLEVKNSLPHGTWGAWIKENLSFSQQHASKFIRAAEEFSNLNSSFNLPQTKIFALLDLPSEEREDFVNSVHEVNGEQKTIDIMSTREVQQLIKEKTQAEEEKKQVESELQMARIQLDTTNKKVTQMKNTIEYQQGQIQEREESIQELVHREPVVIEKESGDYDKIKAENQRLAEQNKTLLDQKQQLARQVQETKALHTDIINLTEFRTNIGSFLDHMAKYTYYAEAFGLIEKRQQTEFEKQLDKIEFWCVEARQAIRGEKTEKSILIEGGYRVE